MVFVRFTGEADHDIRCNSRVLKVFAKLFAKLKIFFGVVVAVHVFQRFVTAALERNVKLRAKLRQCGKLFYNLVRYVVGFERAETHSLKACVTGELHRVAKPLTRVFAVCREVNTDKHHLRKSVFFKLF